LVLKAAVADLAEPAEIDGTGQRVARFALVEPEMGAAAEVGVLAACWILSPRGRGKEGVLFALPFCRFFGPLKINRLRGRARCDKSLPCATPVLDFRRERGGPILHSV
jgi:hypothetical protein